MFGPRRLPPCTHPLHLISSKHRALSSIASPRVTSLLSTPAVAATRTIPTFRHAPRTTASFHTLSPQHAPKNTPNKASAPQQHKWNDSLIHHAAPFALHSDNDSTNEIYMHKMVHEPSNLTVYVACNPRLKHLHQIRWLKPHHSILKRPNTSNGRNLKELRAQLLRELIELVSSADSILLEKSPDPASTDKASSLSTLKTIYPNELWRHLQKPALPYLDHPKLWRSQILHMHLLTYQQLLSVESWMKQHLSTHEVLLDKMRILNEWLGIPDTYLPMRLKQVYRDDLLPACGALVVESSEDVTSRLQTELQQWLERENMPKFGTPSVNYPPPPPAITSKAQKPRIRSVEYPLFPNAGKTRYFSVMFHLPSDAPQLYNSILNMIQGNFLKFRTSIHTNLSKLLGFPPVLLNDMVYDPISRVLEFSFPTLPNRQKIPPEDVASLLSATFRQMASDEKAMKTFLREVLTSLELSMKHNENQFTHLCNYAHYRWHCPEREKKSSTEHSLQEDFFFNRQDVINQLKSNGKDILSDLLKMLIQRREVITYEPSEVWANRMQTLVNRIVKVNVEHASQIDAGLTPQSLLEIDHQRSALSLSDVDRPFHSSSFSFPSEVVELTPTLSVYFDHTPRSDLVDVSLVSLPQVSEAFLSLPIGYLAFLNNFVAYASVSGMGQSDFFKESILWSSGLVSQPKVFLEPRKSVTNNKVAPSPIGLYSALEINTRCTEKTFHHIVDQYMDLVKTSRLTLSEVTPEEFKEAEDSYCQQLQEALRPDVQAAKKHILSTCSTFGFLKFCHNGLSALNQVKELQSWREKQPEEFAKLLRTYVSIYLLSPAKRIITISADPKYRNSLLSEIERAQNVLTTHASADDIKRLEAEKVTYFNQLDAYEKQMESNDVGSGRFIFVEMPKEAETLPCIAVGFKMANALTSEKEYAHCLLFAQLLKTLLKEKAANFGDDLFFNTIDVEHHWSGPLMISGTSTKTSSLDDFHSALASSLNWVFDLSSISHIEKLFANGEVAAKACKSFEAHHREFNRTYDIFNLGEDYNPQRIKNYMLKPINCSDMIQTVSNYIVSKKDQTVDFDKKSHMIVFGNRSPHFVENNSEKWTMQAQ